MSAILYVRVLPCGTVVSWCEIWIPNFKYELAFDLFCLRFNKRVSQCGIEFSKLLQLLFAVFPFYFPAVEWFPFLFVAHQSFLFAAIIIFLQRVPCGQSYIWPRVVRKYVRVCLAYVCMERTHENKWTPNWKKPTEQKRLQVYVAKNCTCIVS